MRGAVNICEPTSTLKKVNQTVRHNKVIRIRGEDEIGKSPVLGGVLFKGEPLVYLS